MRESVADILTSRDLLLQLVRRDIRIRYKQAAMGFLWALFMPTLVVLSGIVVRLIMAKLGGGRLDADVVGGLVVKSVPWGFIVGGLGFTTTSLVGNSSLITKVYFPREVLPVAALLAQGFDSGVGLTAALVVLPFLGLTFTASIAWAPVLLIVIFLEVLAAGLILSCGNIFFRDVRYIVQVFLTFGIFFTPVFFEPAMLGRLGATLVMLNPLAAPLEGLRLALIEGHNLMHPLVVSARGQSVYAWHPWYLLYSTTWALVGLTVAARLFRAAVASFAEYI